MTDITTPPPATRPDTYRAIGKCQRAVAVLSLLREHLRDLWTDSNAAQATAVQQCLEWEREATDRVQLIRDKLHQMPALGPDCEGPRAA